MTTQTNPATILVVDDEIEALRAMAVLLARRGNYHTLTAASGEEALEVLKKNQVDVVITDLRMPGIDGLELLRRINRAYPSIRVIISTAYATVDSAVDALREGATDYLRKPNKPKEMLEKVASILEQQKQVMADLAEMEAVKKREESRTSEFKRAGEMQQRWIPHGFHGKHIRVITGFQSAAELSGDFLDVVEVSPHKLGLVVGDVVGHGLTASLQMGIVQRLIKKDLSEGKPVGKIFTTLNSFLYDEYHLDSAFTAFLAIFDDREFSLSYAIGGHPPPVIFSVGGRPRFLETSCPGLLMIDDYQYVEHRMNLDFGDKLCIYTDGVIEARNPDGELFGETRLLNELEASSREPLPDVAHRIWMALDEYRNGAPIGDDFSIMLVEIV